MRLWMLTNPDLPALSEPHARLYASWEHADPDLARAYRWMADQMAQRGLHTNGAPPFWAWHSHGQPGRRVDLRTFWPIEPTLRLTLEVPDHLALLSDYNDWHHVLNNWHLSANEAEYDRIEALEAAGKLTQQAKEASWQRVFDMTQWNDPHWGGHAEERYIQATLPWFEHAWIRRIEHFDRPRNRRTTR